MGSTSVGLIEIAETRFLLVSVWVAVVPTRSPPGWATVVKVPVPSARRIPAVKVPAPVPPLATESGVANVVPLPNVLLVRVWVAVVPTRSPAGWVTVVKVLPPLARRIPAVKVPAPVPPLPTEIGEEKVVPLPNVLLVSVWVSDVPTTAPVGAATVVNAEVPLALRIPAVKVAAPDPPELTERVPVRLPPRFTGPHDGAADPLENRT